MPESEQVGWPPLRTGDQPVWPPADWSAALGGSRSLREQLRRARAKGVSVRAVAPGELADGAPLRAAVEQLIARWLRSRTMAPMGFLVQVDGYSIYHAGDHALWVEELLPAFTKELEYIRSKAPTIDLAFLPAAKGMAVQCATDSAMIKGVRISALLLRPKAIALQHIGCADQLGSYTQIREALSALPTRWIIPVRFNQSF